MIELLDTLTKALVTAKEIYKMGKLRIVLFLVLGVGLSILLLGTGFSAKEQNPRGQKQETKKLDFNRFPIADFEAPGPADPNARAARERKGSKYSNKHAARITEDTSTLFSNTDWDVQLPALPVDRSAAVVIGRITSATAYVTPDKTNVYSEFELAIDTVVKSDSEKLIGVGRTITIERQGGKVRMPSGKIVLSWVNHQNMPRIGGRYVLFLTHSFATRDDAGQDFYLLTGYELQDGHIQPLDDTLPGHPITAYAGTSESDFLKELFNSVSKLSPSSN